MFILQVTVKQPSVNMSRLGLNKGSETNQGQLDDSPLLEDTEDEEDTVGGNRKDIKERGEVGPALAACKIQSVGLQPNQS